MGKFFATLREQMLEPFFWLLIVAAYLFRMNALGLGQPEELFFIQPAREMVQAYNWSMPLFNGQPYLAHPPLFTWLVALSFQIFDVSFWSAKLPSVLLGLLGLPVFYFLAMNLLGNRMSAFLGTFALAGSWGYFWAAHTATPAVASVVLLQLLCLLFFKWFQLSARLKLYQRDRQVLSLAMGITFGVLFLLAGSFGVVFAGVLFLLTLVLSGRPERLAGLDWRRFLSSFLVVALPWPLWVSWAENNPSFLLDYLFQMPEVSLVPFSLVAYIKNLAFALFPWNLFFIAALVDKKGLSRMLHNDRESTLFLLIWAVLALAVPAVLGSGELLAFLPLFPPLILLTAQYLTSLAGSTRPYEIATDAVILVLLMVAVVSTFMVFQILPDEYPGSFWPFPGPAVIAKLDLGKEIVLPNQFPVWKLWMLPGTLLLLVGAIYVYFLTRTERSHEAPLTLAGLSALMVVFMSVAVVPIMNRSFGAHFAGLINRQLQAPQANGAPATQDGGNVLIYAGNDPQMLRLPFFLEDGTRNAPVPKTHILTNLDGMSRSMAQAREDQPNFAVLDERSYYKLPADVRVRYRVVGNTWKWCGTSPSAFQCWFPASAPSRREIRNFKSEVLLLELLPPLEDGGAIPPYLHTVSEQTPAIPDPAVPAPQ